MRAIYLALLVCVAGWGQDPGLRILDLEPTVLFPAGEPLRQVALLKLFNGGGPVKCGAEITVAGQVSPARISLEIPSGASTQRVFIPDLGAPAALSLTLRTDSGSTLAKLERIWQPQRHWKVYIVKSSHEDLGYEDFIFGKQHDIANYVEMARKIARHERRYRYTLESLLFQRNYMEERSEAAWREIVEKAIKPGHLPLMGEPSGVHSHWMDYEEIARMNYAGRREMRDRFGLDLKTYMIVDNPSLSWAGCQAVADAGFRYVARWGQGWRTGGNNDYKTTKLPAIFWWGAPDGKNKVLFAWRSHYSMVFWYGMAHGGYGGLFELGAENINRQLKAVERGDTLGPYPYDALVNPEYTDHDTPSFYGSALRELSKRYRYPEIIYSGSEDFFEYVERQYGEKLPTLSGDLNNFSADYATIDPASMGAKRRAARLLPLAEGLSALAAARDASFLPPARLIDRTFTRLMDYDEHSWPTLPPASDVQLFNAQWIKQHEGYRALDAAQRAFKIGFDALTRHIPNSAGPAVVVFNPLAHARTDLATIKGSFEAFVDPDTGRSLPAQALADGTTIFLATDVPAYGYKIFRPAPRKTAQNSLAATRDTLSNRYYEIRFDATGAIRSIHDKELKREIVDSAAPNRFNQLVYVHTEGRESKQYARYSPTGQAAMSATAGPVRAEHTSKMDDATTGAAITQTVILYDNVKRIDIVNDLRHVRALYTDRYEARYCDNIFYAFPVKVAPFEARAEYAGGVVRPYDDQLRWGSHDYLCANRWVNVSNPEFGVTMAPWEAITVNFGDIRYNHFSIDYKPTLSHLYSYAYSNRMAGLLTLAPEDMNAKLGYSFTTHAGSWDKGGAAAFGWSVASPLETRLIGEAQRGGLPPAGTSFVKVSAPNVQLVTLKQSEQPGRGWVLRLVETEGKASEVTVDLPHFTIAGAAECDLVENDRARIEATAHQVRLKIGAYAFATIRLYSPAATPAAVENPRAAALSDKSIRLTWTGAASAYNVYRSDDPDAPPTAYSLVARTMKPEFIDDWLKIATPYYYHVAAVTPTNEQGPVSPRFDARTLAVNTSPPAPVDELGVVRRAADRLIVYWRTSPEPDVARYCVYRAETPRIDIGTLKPLATLNPARFFLQTYIDRGLQPGRKYYYKVVAEDWAGHRQTKSALASAATPAR
jgi:hypothetical protein